MGADVTAALRMIDAFASVGAKVFDVTITDDKGDPVEGLQRRHESLYELRRRIARDLQDGERNRHNVIIRPRSTTALLVQLDDFTPEKAAQIEPYAFMTICTSPGNGQVWLAVSDGPKESDKEAAKQFRIRARRGAGSDKSATGATRIAGSLNFKPEYAPAFPRVEITRLHAGATTTVAALEQAGLLAEAEQPQPPASIPLEKTPPPARPGRNVTGRNAWWWPDYDQLLRNQTAAHRKPDGSPDRSKADYFFARLAAKNGHSMAAIAQRLYQVSPRAQERVNGKKDVDYPAVIAAKAISDLENERASRLPVKSTARPG